MPRRSSGTFAPPDTTVGPGAFNPPGRAAPDGAPHSAPHPAPHAAPHAAPPIAPTRLATSAGLLVPFVPLGALLPVGIFPGELTLGVVLVLAEVLAWLGATADSALDHVSRARLLEQADPSDRSLLERRLGRFATLRFTARLVRYLGNATLVLALGYMVFRWEGRSDGYLPILPAAAAVLAAFGLTFLVNDVLARIVAERAPERTVHRLLPVLSVLAWATTPLRVPLAGLVRLLFRVRLEDDPSTARDEVKESVEEGEREGSFSAAEAEMIGSILSLKSSRVEDVMTLRGDMVSVAETDSLDDAVDRVNAEGYSRIPVHRRDRDDIVGVLYARDLLHRWRDRGIVGGAAPTVAQLMRPAYFVPSGKLVVDLLKDMQVRKVHLAVVVDEHTRVAGVVTIEDLVEVIVGDIQDEYDEEVEALPPTPEQLAGGSLEVDGRTAIEDVNRALDVRLPITDDYETVGGLMFHELGKVPEAGDRVDIESVVLTVLEADERTVRRLQVTRA